MEISSISSTQTPDWVVIDTDRLQRLKAPKGRCSIYGVPSYITARNDAAYRPQLVSVGPYHHGELRLKPMEEHKHRALYRVLERSGESVKKFQASLGEVVDQLMECYEQLGQKWRDDHNKFVELMLLDGCFLLEILRVWNGEDDLGYTPGDPIFSTNSTFKSVLFRDLLKLENQQPLLALERLVAVEKRIAIAPITYICNLMCYSLSRTRSSQGSSSVSSLHMLDQVRNNTIGGPWQKQPNYEKAKVIYRKATDYSKLGIIFKKKETNLLSDINLRDDTLHLPCFKINNLTEPAWLNAVAFERLHAGLSQEITAYIEFMGGIIRSVEDVELLKNLHLIDTSLPTDEKVLEFVQMLDDRIDFYPVSSLNHVVVALNDRVKTGKFKRVIHFLGFDFKRTYFKSPWTLIGLVAATFLLILTVCQTVYTILSFYSST
ncbi:UPF0481 protein At3g47200-like [Aristolochia californica]|uniref:UPF0481 protein At3g47200-like n=1 Tax=Aristolochia californica TaxID=171875 RepID=UPI0035DB9FBC